MAATTGASSIRRQYISQAKSAPGRGRNAYKLSVGAHPQLSVTNWNVHRAVDKRSVTHNGRSTGTNLIDLRLL